MMTDNPDTPAGMIAEGHPMGLMISGPEWRYFELPTSHWPMFTRPDDMATVLSDVAQSDTPTGR